MALTNDLAILLGYCHSTVIIYRMHTQIISNKNNICINELIKTALF